MTFPTLTRRQVWDLQVNERGRPLVAMSWTYAFLDALDDPTKPEILIWLRRQMGKSTSTMQGGATSELLCVPNSYTLFLAAAEHQAQAVFERKLRRPLERLAKELGIFDEIKFTKNGVEIPSLNSALKVIANNEATGTGRSPTLLIFDEARDIDDAMYETLAPSVIGAGGKIVIASTAGRPVGFFHALVTNPTDGTLLITSDVNENPEANRGVLSFLRRRLGLLSPTAAARELDNTFTDDGDELIPAALIDAAIDDDLTAVL